jgi:uncharacterized protein
MIKKLFSIAGFTLFSVFAMASGPLPYPIIDAHVHLEFTNEKIPESGIIDSKERFISDAKKYGIGGFVCHTRTEKSKVPTVEGMSGAFCAGIREQYDISVVEEGIKSKKFKCIKIYLGYVYKYPYDEFYTPLYKLAAKYKVPVVFHTGDTVTKDGKVKYAHPLGIDEVAVEHRDVNFVIAHIGNPWIESAGEVIYKNPNVYGDVSALMIGDLTRLSKQTSQKMVWDPVSWIIEYVENADKLMFGTDWPLVDEKQYLDLLIKVVPKKDQKKFFHDNAARIFDL